jgi:hypothetical protein
LQPLFPREASAAIAVPHDKTPTNTASYQHQLAKLADGYQCATYSFVSVGFPTLHGKRAGEPFDVIQLIGHIPPLFR